MGIAMDGLASNLDTSAIIKALMDVESIPRTLLSAKSDDRKYVITQLQSLNTALQELFTKASSLRTSAPTSLMTATASSDAVTATARTGTAALSTQIVVDSVATTHGIVTAAVSAFADDPLVLTIENAAGGRIEVRPESSSPADVAQALTAAGAGVSATAVAAGRDVDDNPLFRLQITATESGADGAFRVFLGDADAVAGGLATDLSAQPGAAVVTQGTDAQVRLWAGTAAEQTVTSSSNTFVDLFPGVDVTVTKASADPVTVTVASDTAASTTAVADFVKQITAVLSGIAKGSTATPATSAGGSTTLGVFTGDSTVRALRTALTDAVQYPVDGVSPSTIGISFDKSGNLTFDEAAFTAALARDPAAVEAVFSGITTRVADVTDQYSDKYDGLLTSRITGQQDEVRRLADQLDQWDVRLEKRRATLERTYAAMETMLSRLQSQQSYLTSQLDSLASSRSSS